jgi:hypothetical protein
MPAMHVDEYEDPLARRIKGFGSASSGLGRQADTYVRPKPVGLTRHPSLVLDVSIRRRYLGCHDHHCYHRFTLGP